MDVVNPSSGERSKAADEHMEGNVVGRAERATGVFDTLGTSPTREPSMLTAVGKVLRDNGIRDSGQRFELAEPDSREFSACKTVGRE